jgi:hypothetical protein
MEQGEETAYTCETALVVLDFKKGFTSVVELYRISPHQLNIRLSTDSIEPNLHSTMTLFFAMNAPVAVFTHFIFFITYKLAQQARCLSPTRLSSLV